MFDGASNVQLLGRLLRVYYTKLKFMRGVEHKEYLFFNAVYKIPILHKIIYSHKMIYTIFGSGIYHKPHSILNQNLKSFTIKKLVFLAEMRLGCMDISWGCKETCGCKRFFNILYPLQNLSVLLPIMFLTN